MKEFSVFLTILCLFSSICLIQSKIQAAKATPTIVTVDDDQPANFTSIQEAINSVDAGSTILVLEGLYIENVIVNKSVSLIGESNMNTTVEGNNIDCAFRITASGVQLSNFSIRNSGGNVNGKDYAIRMEQRSSGNTISYNRIIGNTHGGIAVDFSNGNKIVNNTLSANGVYAVYIHSSTGNFISDNVISRNVAGVSLLSSFSNNISDNIIVLNDGDGISLFGSDRNLVFGNVIRDNAGGAYVVTSVGNVIYHNNFINNTPPSDLEGSNSTWDNGFEGNYWSNYAGRDLNSDGIGDTPYRIDETDLHDYDNYPLMGPFSDFPITSKGEDYHVAIISNSTVTGVNFKLGTETGNRILDFSVICGNESNGFCRMTIPTKLMEYPYVMLIGNEDILLAPLPASNETRMILYFTYAGPSQNIIIIWSRVQSRYDELLIRYNETKANLDALNATYRALSYNYSILNAQFLNLNTSYGDLSYNYLILQMNLNNISDAHDLLMQNYNSLVDQLSSLNLLYNDLQKDLSETGKNYLTLLDNYTSLQFTITSLTLANTNLINGYSALVGNYSRLQLSYSELNASYVEHLSNALRQSQNLQSLTYIFAAVTAVFIMTTVYLTKNAHEGKTARARESEEKDQA